MLIMTGRAWCFGDRVDTDDMYPGSVMALPVEQAARHMFASSRPGWPDLVEPGDIVVGGRGFGIGSSRPVALLLAELGVACVVADGLNSLFERNCVNYGLPVLAAPGVRAAVREGDRITVDVERAVVTTSDGTLIAGRPYPELVLRIMRRGGLVRQLREDGLIESGTGKD
jgi:3-isopropylmalate/(R)-2-methylmalate dehydratase small subunit